MLNNELSVKLQRVRELMAQEGLTGIYIKRQDNFSWLSCGRINYIAAGGDMGNCGLLVTADKTYAICNNIEAPRMRDEEQLEELGFPIHFGAWHDNGFEGRTIAELGGDKVAKDHGPASIHAKIQKLRFSLTPEEIERYQVGGMLVSRLVEEIAASIRPGMTEIEVAGMMEGRARADGLNAISVFCGSDERIYKYRHPIATAKVIRERVQMGGNFRYKGLTICLTRYVNFVPLTDELRKQYLDNVRVDCMLMAASVAGESYQKPLLTAKAAYEELGYPGEFEKHHQGGPIGYVPRDYRVDYSIDGIIPENQAFCWNPSITGTKSEDTIISTKDGIIFVTKPYLYPTVKLEVNGQTFERVAILEKY